MTNPGDDDPHAAASSELPPGWNPEAARQFFGQAYRTFHESGLLQVWEDQLRAGIAADTRQLNDDSLWAPGATHRNEARLAASIELQTNALRNLETPLGFFPVEGGDDAPSRTYVLTRIDTETGREADPTTMPYDVPHIDVIVDADGSLILDPDFSEDMYELRESYIELGIPLPTLFDDLRPEKLEILLGILRGQIESGLMPLPLPDE